MKSFAVAAALAPLISAQQLCDQFGYISKDGWYFNNNAWGSGSGTGSQCTTVDSTDPSSGCSWHSEWQWSGGENNVKSYPYSGRVIDEKPLLSSVSSIPASVDWSYSGDNIRADVAYDLFTSADPNHDTSSGDFELMIWLANKGNVYPIGESTGQVDVAGSTWELWDGYNGDMHVYSFVSGSEIPQIDFDINSFFNHLAAAKGFPKDSQHLLTVQFGTEPFTGGPATFTVNHWSAWVNL